MTAYVSKIIIWDKADINELRDLLNKIDREEIDMSDLPTADIPEDVDTSFPVWAMDNAGNMLVGDSADQIMTLAEYRTLMQA